MIARTGRSGKTGGRSAWTLTLGAAGEDKIAAKEGDARPGALEDRIDDLEGDRRVDQRRPGLCLAELRPGLAEAVPVRAPVACRRGPRGRFPAGQPALLFIRMTPTMRLDLSGSGTYILNENP